MIDHNLAFSGIKMTKCGNFLLILHNLYLLLLMQRHNKQIKHIKLETSENMKVTIDNVLDTRNIVHIKRPFHNVNQTRCEAATKLLI